MAMLRELFSHSIDKDGTHADVLLPLEDILGISLDDIADDPEKFARSFDNRIVLRDRFAKAFDESKVNRDGGKFATKPGQTSFKPTGDPARDAKLADMQKVVDAFNAKMLKQLKGKRRVAPMLNLKGWNKVKKQHKPLDAQVALFARQFAHYVQRYGGQMGLFDEAKIDRETDGKFAPKGQGGPAGAKSDEPFELERAPDKEHKPDEFFDTGGKKADQGEMFMDRKGRADQDLLFGDPAAEEDKPAPKGGGSFADVDALGEHLKAEHQAVDILHLSEGDRYVKLDHVRMKAGERGTGAGSKIMRALQEYATAKDKPIVLEAQPEARKKKALFDFYRSHGFKKPGRQRDYSLPAGHTHIWRPRFGLTDRFSMAFAFAAEKYYKPAAGQTSLWDEEEHPREAGGEFAEKEGGTTATIDPPPGEAINIFDLGKENPRTLADAEKEWAKQPKEPKPEPSGTAEPFEPTEKQVKAADRLRGMADKMIEKAEESLNQDRQTHTRRMAHMAANATNSAWALEAFAHTVENVADAIERGDADLLGGITTKAHVETLDRLLSRGKSDWISKDHNYAYYEQHKDDPITEDNIGGILEQIGYPFPRPNPSSLGDLAQEARDGAPAELKELGEKWAKRALGWRKADSFPSVRDTTEIAEIRSLATWGGKRGGRQWAATAIKDDLKQYDHLQKLGIDTKPQLRDALRQLYPLKGKRGKESPVQSAERKLVGTRLAGFFPTPKGAVTTMLDKADIQPGHRVLEPSAGKGDIMDMIREKHPEAKLQGVEFAHSLKDVLDAKDHNVEFGDFLDHAPEKPYDRIVMNPPFEKGQDIEHLKHAVSMLAPGGRVVSIAGEHAFFAGDKKAVAAREWLDRMGADVTKMPAGSFTTKSGAFRHTGVNSRMIVIDLPHKYSRRGYSMTPLAEKFQRAMSGVSLVDRFQRAMRPELYLSAPAPAYAPAKKKPKPKRQKKQGKPKTPGGARAPAPRNPEPDVAQNPQQPQGGQPAGEQSNWVQMPKGPRGGQPWKNTATGELQYGDRPPANDANRPAPDANAQQAAEWAKEAPGHNPEAGRENGPQGGAQEPGAPEAPGQPEGADQVQPAMSAEQQYPQNWHEMGPKAQSKWIEKKAEKDEWLPLPVPPSIGVEGVDPTEMDQHTFKPLVTIEFDGSAGIRRSEMPQVVGKNVNKFLTHLGSAGIGNQTTDDQGQPLRIDASQLKPTQANGEKAKVMGMIQSMHADPRTWFGDPNDPSYKPPFPPPAPILVSSDGYILDGHHRWAAIKAYNEATGKSEGLAAIRVNAPIKSMLKYSHTFGAQYKTLGDKLGKPGEGSDIFDSEGVEIDTHGAALDYVNDLTGKGTLTEEHLAQVAGSPPGTKFRAVIDNEGTLFMQTGEIDDPVHNQRRISKDANGNAQMRLDYQRIKKTGQGLGTSMLRSTAISAQRMGIKSMVGQMTRSDDPKNPMNGYYTYALYGFDGPLPQSVRQKVDHEGHGQQFQNARTVQGLMDMEGGPEWWKEHGDTFQGTMDLEKDSQGMKILEHYYASKRDPAQARADVPSTPFSRLAQGFNQAFSDKQACVSRYGRR